MANDRVSDRAAWRGRVQGCLLGGALGDALGAPFEGARQVAPHAVREWVDSDRPLRWTDDTALQLALAEYVARLDDLSSFDDDQLARWFADTWSAEPQRGYGGNPPQIFRTVIAGGSWRQAATSSFGGTGSLGNGGAMRLPERLLHRLERHDQIIRVADALADRTHAWRPTS